MKLKNTARLFALTGIAAVLAACGGNDGDATATAPVPAPAVVPTTTPVAVTVIDGAIRNALVCVDKNLNNACDADEASGRTDASGNVTLQVLNADAGRFPVLAIVGTDAVDADHGAVPTPFKLKTPADKPAAGYVVSPLTTLVQTTIEDTGTTRAAAEAAVQNQLGVTASLFQDFTKVDAEKFGSSAVNLGNIARMIVVTTQENTKNLSAAIGQQAIDGSTITAADVEKTIQRNLLAVLPTVVSNLADPRVAAAANKGDVINTLAKELVASPTTGLNTTTLATLVGVANQAAKEVAEAPTANASLRALSFNDVSNWTRRILTATAAQNTPVNGLLRNTDQRTRRTSGVEANWSAGGNPQGQSDLHWNGASWVQCSLTQEHTTTVRDALGRNTYDYCDKLETGVSTQASFDIAGQTIASVYANRIAGANITNISVSQPSVLGTATFPAGSRLAYVSNSPTATAVAYSPNINSIVRNTRADIAAGRTSPTVTSDCTLGAYPSTEAATLESVIAGNRGTPCVNTPNSNIVVNTTVGGTATVSSGERNEAWNQSTVSVGIVGTASVGAPQPATALAYYTTNTVLRAAFGDNNVVKYYSCRQRATDGAVRNCDQVGTGTYSIATLGDARVLSMSNPPAQAGALTTDRILVERGGRVYVGYKSRVTPTNQARLNPVAMNALFTQLGMPEYVVGQSFNLTPASYQGEWNLSSATDLVRANSTVITFQPFFTGSNPAYSCREVSEVNGLQTSTPIIPCTVTLNAATGAITVSVPDGTGTGTLGFVAGTGTGTFTPTAGAAESIVARRR
jgi:hypothetical protein